MSSWDWSIFYRRATQGEGKMKHARQRRVRCGNEPLVPRCNSGNPKNCIPNAKSFLFYGLRVFLVSSQDALRLKLLEKCLLCPSLSNFINRLWLTLANGNQYEDWFGAISDLPRYWLRPVSAENLFVLNGLRWSPQVVSELGVRRYWILNIRLFYIGLWI